MFKYSNGREYKVRIGTRGGRYILVKGKKVYIGKETTRGGNNEDLKDPNSVSDLDDSDFDDDEDTTKLLILNYMKNYEDITKCRINISENIKTFLKTRTDYMIIGGKAAVYYISKLYKNDNSSQNNLKIAMESTDYDVMIPQDKSDSFVEAMRTALQKCQFEDKHAPSINNDEEIIMFGVTEKNIMKSFIDLHIVTTSKYNDLNKQCHIGTDGLRYISQEKLCADLELYTKEKPSNLEEFKYHKRMARKELLDCKT